MLCEICNQNQATIHIQKINKGEKTTFHVCAACAAEKGLDVTGTEGINVAEILYKLSAPLQGKHKNLLSGSDDLNALPDSSVTTNIICPKCKWDTRKFQETGRLGCEHCYQTFSGILSETLRNIHRGVTHVGKAPSIGSSGPNLIMLDILNLQKQLDGHIKREEFEKAAELRDKINNLKAKMEHGKK